MEDRRGLLGSATTLGSSISPATENELGETWVGQLWKCAPLILALEVLEG